MKFINILWFSVICYILIMYLLRGIFHKNKKIILKKETKKPNIAFLIPARREEEVIGQLLESIMKQTVPIAMKDVYVIVEDLQDKTGDIAKKYGATVLYRITNTATKGNALNDGVKQILAKKKYDLYFIFDADNILDCDYIKNILPSYYAGYDIAIGYRNCKNGNDNVIAASSTLIFSMINTLINRTRKKHGKNMVISGTGFFIKGTWIHQWEGYPFQTLTEDYELSLYAASHGLKTDYVENAVFYDEQPITYKQTLIQRKRWVYGYFTSTKQYMKEMKKTDYQKGLLDIVPIIVLLILIIGYQLFQLFLLLYHKEKISIFFFRIIGILIFIYFVLWMITGITLWKEKNKLNLNSMMKVKVWFYNPIFLIGYVQCVISLLIHGKVEWTPIKHHRSKN